MAQRFSNLGFMQVSFGTFFTALFFLLISMIIAIATNGHAPLVISVLWVAAFGLSLIGLYVTWYGHFKVQAESKVPWNYGLITNGVVLALLTAIYAVGIIYG